MPRLINLTHTIVDLGVRGFIKFGSKLYRHIVGISMGTNCALLVADLFCFVMRETLCCLCQTIIKLILLKLLTPPPDI